MVSTLKRLRPVMSIRSAGRELYVVDLNKQQQIRNQQRAKNEAHEAENRNANNNAQYGNDRVYIAESF